MVRCLVLSLLVAGACGSAPPPAPTPAPVPTPSPAPLAADGPDCAAAATAVATALHEVDAARADMIVVVQRHCADDGWSAEARACIAAVTTHDEALTCAHKHLTGEQHDLVSTAMKALMGPEPSSAPATGSQAALAAQADKEGRDAMYAGKYAVASAKFRDAVARVPEPKYFFNLCTALFQEGRFAEAMTACAAGDKQNPGDALHQKLVAMLDKIRAEAKAQGILLP